MDIRKKEIRDLEAKKRRDLDSINKLLENLGESLLSRMHEDVPEYLQSINAIQDAEGRIGRAEEDILRLKHIREELRRREKELAEALRQLALIHTRLGEAALRTPDYEDFAAPYQERLSALLLRTQNLEERLETLEAQGGGNVFAWIGRNTQSMVIRSFLGKNRYSLQRLYAEAGEKFVQSPPEGPGASGEAGELLRDFDANLETREEIQRALGGLREDRRQINDAYSADGGPGRKIQALRRHISLVEERLRLLYLARGKQAEEAGGGGQPVTDNDQAILEKARELRQAVAGAERQIERLTAALAIDEERGKIDKMEQSIRDNRDRIAAAEAVIEDLTQKIADAKDHIQELSHLL
ncbi:MAG: hypothetical protein LBD37_01450 [Treponema sp.]|jgi:chromosome segregation ATPase|nr:hypothetical protein [Treponema sp.]